MIAKHERDYDRADVWRMLAAPVDAAAIAWRQDGKVTARDGRFIARFVAYIEANTVRERLDAVVPGEWDLTLELLPQITGIDENDAVCSFKARLQVLGVIREDVGTGRDYKSASTDAFKRAAVRFGIGHELYGYEQNWVEVDGDGRFPKPLEDPAAAYARRYGKAGEESTGDQAPARTRRPASRPPRPAPFATGESAASSTPLPEPLAAADSEIPPCPSCNGAMWDNRLTKRNPKAPDFKCRNRSCDGVVWPARGAAATTPANGRGGSSEGSGDTPEPAQAGFGPLVPVADDELPF